MLTLVYTENDKAIFYRCSHCSWYKGVRIDSINDLSYEEYETFDARQDKFDSNVIEATRILKTKFKLLNFIPNYFLDIGCSEGVFLKAYQTINPTGKCSGIEVSSAKQERARGRGLTVGGYNDIKDKFDFVLLRHVIEHVETPKEFVYSILEKYVQTGGVLCIETPNNACISDFIKGKKIRNGIYMKDVYPFVHVCGFTPKTFKTLFPSNIQYLGTHNVYDEDWCYHVERKKNIKYQVLKRIKFSNNIACIVKK